MPIMEWNDSLDIGVDKMNDDHKAILKYMNLLFDRSAEGAPRSELESLLESLVKVTVTHFKEEEEYMRSINFEQVDAHAHIHAGTAAGCRAEPCMIDNH